MSEILLISRKGIKIGTKVQQTKDVIYESYYDLQDEFDCETGYEDGVKCDEDNCNGDYDGKNDDNITPCKDVASYKDSEDRKEIIDAKEK